MNKTKLRRALRRGIVSPGKYEFLDGNTNVDLLRNLQRPLELDLEAAFKAMQEDVMRELLAAVKDGASPDEAIRRVDAMLRED